MILLWFVLGAAAGAASTLAQGWTVSRLTPQRARLALAVVVAGAALRLAAAGLILLAAFQRGLELGLAAVAGMWLARWVTLYRLSQGPR